MPLSLLPSLAVLTGVAWFLTIFQAVSMSMPMGIAVSAGMAIGGVAATGGCSGMQSFSLWSGP